MAKAVTRIAEAAAEENEIGMRAAMSERRRLLRLTKVIPGNPSEEVCSFIYYLKNCLILSILDKSTSNRNQENVDNRGSAEVSGCWASSCLYCFIAFII